MSDWWYDLGCLRFMASYNEDFSGIAFYLGYFKEDECYEIILQIGKLELGIAIK